MTSKQEIVTIESRLYPSDRDETHVGRHSPADSHIFTSLPPISGKNAALSHSATMVPLERVRPPQTIFVLLVEQFAPIRLQTRRCPASRKACTSMSSCMGRVLRKIGKVFFRSAMGPRSEVSESPRTRVPARRPRSLDSFPRRNSSGTFSRLPRASEFSAPTQAPRGGGRHILTMFLRPSSRIMNGSPLLALLVWQVLDQARRRPRHSGTSSLLALAVRHDIRNDSCLVEAAPASSSDLSFPAT